VHSWDHFLFGGFAGLIMYWLTLAACLTITGGKTHSLGTGRFSELRTVIFTHRYSLSLASSLFIQPWFHYILDGLTLLGEVKG